MTNTKLEVEKLFFEEGIPGFSDLQFFQLVREDLSNPFYTLQSVEDEQISFWVTDPFFFCNEYEFTLHDQNKSALRIGEDTPMDVLTIVSIQDNGQVTTNLRAPIIINKENRMAKQVILNEEKYSIRYSLFTVHSKVVGE